MINKAITATCCLALGTTACKAADPKPWNILYIMADDVGYGDVSCFGSTKIKTPNIDSIAADGMKCTAFYTQPVSGPSRTSVLTGCYPARIKQYAPPRQYTSHPFVHLDEVLTPEILKPQGYVSAAIGKWDLNGHVSYFPNNITPIKHGFDYFYGRPQSGGPIYRNEKKSPQQVHPALFDQTFTDEAIRFITNHKDQPFFVYLAYTTAHSMAPLAATEQFLGTSDYGLYGDSVQEMDFNIGRLLQTLKKLGLEENTLVIFTSDNGPWPYFTTHPSQRDKRWFGPYRSGTTGSLRGQKTETWEGGVRVPFMIKAPGLIPAGTESDELVRLADMLPTFAALTGAKMTQQWKIDGKNMMPLFTGKTDRSPVKFHYYYFQSHLQAVRDERYKLVLSRPATPAWLSDHGQAERFRGRDVEEITTPELYDLKTDIGETKNIAYQHPKKVQELLNLAAQARQDIGDYNQRGENCRTNVHWAKDRRIWLEQ